jgi:hypothetical protein
MSRTPIVALGTIYDRISPNRMCNHLMECFFQENVPLLKKFPNPQKIIKYICMEIDILFDAVASFVSQCAKTLHGPFPSLASYRQEYHGALQEV